MFSFFFMKTLFQNCFFLFLCSLVVLFFSFVFFFFSLHRKRDFGFRIQFCPSFRVCQTTPPKSLALPSPSSQTGVGCSMDSVKRGIREVTPIKTHRLFSKVWPELSNWWLGNRALELSVAKVAEDEWAHVWKDEQ